MSRSVAFHEATAQTADGHQQAGGDEAGELPVALTGASLWLAWTDSGGAHTATDTTTITAQQAPLWHTLRGAT